MALAGNTNDSFELGPLKVVFGELAFDSSYPTGGEAFTASTFGLTRLDRVVVLPSLGYVFTVDYANSKVLAYWVDTTVDGAAMAQVVNTTDLSAVVAAQFIAFGA